MSLLNKVAEFLDPQMVLDLIKNEEKHNSADSSFKPLKLEALEATLRVDDYLAAGGDSTRANEMRTRLAQLNSDDKDNANYLYAAGRYRKSLDVLASSGSPNVWGEYAANVMLGNYEEAAAILPAIQDQVESGSDTGAQLQSALSQLNMRTWFVHWSLFSLFRIDGGCDKIVDSFFQSQSMTTIQAACPWVLRYLAVAVVLGLPNRYPLQNKRFKDLTRAIVQESYEYSDPVLDFITGLSVQYQDVPTLANKLASAQQLLSEDYFCEPLLDSFVKSARALILASYTKTHSKINVESVAQDLGISKDQIMGYLKSENLTPASSSTANIYLVSSRKPSMGEIISEKTKVINQRGAAALSQAQSKHEK